MVISTPSSRVVQAVLASLGQHTDVKRFWLAYSGGIDSHVLLHVLAAHQHLFENATFHAVHINHALNVKSDQWAEHCRKVCEQLKLPCLNIDVDATPAPGESPEARARNVRYEAILRLIREGDCLLTAHHQDDQVETLLLQLMRGSGPKGLAAMPESAAFGQGKHLRPMMNVRREEIHSYAVANQLKWITDDSNLDLRFDRNFIRHQIVPALQKRWPSLAQTISRSARYCAEAVEILELSAKRALQDINPDNKPFLSVNALLKYGRIEQRNILRYWIHSQALATPTAVQLEQVLEQLASAAEDASPKISWECCEIRRYRGELYAMRRLGEVDNEQTVSWDMKGPLVVDGIGVLSATKAMGRGVAKKFIDHGKMQVRFRQGGEILQPAGRQGHHALKKLFQERGIPPWVRDRTPLIYIRDQLAAVGEMFVSEEFHAAADEDAYIFQWESWQQRDSAYPMGL